MAAPPKGGNPKPPNFVPRPPTFPPATPPKVDPPKVVLTPKGPAANAAVTQAAQTAQKKAATSATVSGAVAKAAAQEKARPSSPAATLAKIHGGNGPAKGTGGLTQQSQITAAKNKAAQEASGARYSEQAKRILIQQEAARDKNKASQYTSGSNKPPKFTPPKPPKFTPKNPNPRGPGGVVITNPFQPPDFKPPKFVVDEEPADETAFSGGFGPSSYSTPAPRQSLVPARDVVDFSTPPATVEAMQQVLFEELSSFELVNMARRDTVEGLNPYYSVISNLSSIRTQYDPSRIISLQDSLQITDLYQISLDSKIPDAAYLARNNITNFFYIDANGDFVIELDNLLPDEFVEIQIASSGKIT